MIFVYNKQVNVPSNDSKLDGTKALAAANTGST